MTGEELYEAWCATVRDRAHTDYRPMHWRNLLDAERTAWTIWAERVTWEVPKRRRR